MHGFLDFRLLASLVLFYVGFLCLMNIPNRGISSNTYGVVLIFLLPLLVIKVDLFPNQLMHFLAIILLTFVVLIVGACFFANEFRKALVPISKTHVREAIIKLCAFAACTLIATLK